MNLKKTLAVLLSALMALSCGSAFAEAAANDQYFKKFDPPISMSTHQIVNTTTLFQDDDTVENNGWTRWQKENLGIDWKVAWTAPDGPTNEQKLDLAFASGDLPDVISPTPAQLARYVQAGMIQPIDELIEKYASPLIKWAIADAVEQTQGAYFLPATIGGKIYAFPQMSDTIVNWDNGFIRTDILKELGMEKPTTIAEMEAVFAAYKEAYPDLYPFALDNELPAIQIVTAPYKAAKERKGSWVKLADGTLGFGSIQPEAKQALAKLAEWYEKGYIDPEFVVKNNEKMKEDVIAGNFLVYYGSWASIASPFTPMWNHLPNASVEVLPFLLGDDGKTAVYDKTWFPTLRAVTTNCENPEALIYLLNENWDSTYRNELELRDQMSKEYGYEFKYPVTEERQPINLEEVARDYPSAAQPRELWKYDYPTELEGCGFLNNFYTQYPKLFGFTGAPVTMLNRDLKSMAAAVRENDMTKLTVNGITMYNEWTNSHPNMLTNWALTEQYWSEFEKSGQYIADAFAGAPTETMSEKWAYLEKLELETYTRIIMGSQPIEAFDEFVANWNSNGGAEITAEVNAWYSANQN